MKTRRRRYNRKVKSGNCENCEKEMKTGYRSVDRSTLSKRFLCKQPQKLDFQGFSFTICAVMQDAGLEKNEIPIVIISETVGLVHILMLI